MIRLGEYDYSTDNSSSWDGIPWDYSPADIIYHPEYSANYGYHDLALVRLNETLDPFHVSVLYFLNFKILNLIKFKQCSDL